MVVFAIGSVGLLGAYHLLWQRSLALFWFAVALIAAALAWIVATDAYLDIARVLWPIAFDEVRGPEIRRRVDCAGPKLWGTGFLLAPIMLALAPWLLKEKRLWMKALAGVGLSVLFILISASSIPDKVAQLIDRDVEQKLPAHCQQRGS